jgi:hypothetical protein
VEELKGILEEAGFTQITVRAKEKSDEIIKSWDFGEGVENMVFSAYIRAIKPPVSHTPGQRVNKGVRLKRSG